MLKDWVWPFLGMMAKAVLLIAVLSGVWVGSAMFHEKAYRKVADDVIQVRVRAENLRPDWVTSGAQAREYDLQIREVNLLAEQTKLLNRRMNDLLERTERVEAIRAELVQGRVNPRAGGVGGPAPSKKR